MSVEVLKARIRRYNSDLDPASESFGAALVLISGAEYGQNIDRLTKRTGLARVFVSRCARRLIDNGVWESGRTVAEWEPRGPASGTFWNDVAVAEGKMCRRARTDGSLEWAPAGFWNKNFHFLDPDAESRLGTHYMDSEPAASTTDSDDSEPDADTAGDPADDPAGADTNAPADGNGMAASLDPLFGEEADPGFPPAQADIEDTGDPARAKVDVDGPAEDDAIEVENPVPSLRHVFRDAVWLG